MSVEATLPAAREPAASASLARRLAWLTLLRLALLFTLLFLLVRSAPSLADASSPTGRGAFALLTLALALSAGWAVWLRTGRRLSWLATAQVVADQATWTGVVYLTGGASSGATSLYGISCLIGATLVGVRGALLAALTAVLAYSALVATLARGLVAPPSDQPARLYVLSLGDLAYHGIVNALVLAVVTALAAFLAERLRLAGGQVELAEARALRAERLAALGTLTTGLAHEIRNPLGSIAASVKLLQGAPGLGMEDRELCAVIQREAARLDDLVTDMMDLARPREPRLAPIDLKALLSEVVQLATQSGRGVEDVRVELDAQSAPIVEADQAQLRQLVWNLVRNAVQASAPGSVVGVELRDEGGAAILEIVDRGAGIEPAALGRIFDAFYTTRSSGTGIGLAVVKRIAEDHGFPIDVTSAPGVGTRFRVRLVDERSHPA